MKFEIPALAAAYPQTRVSGRNRFKEHLCGDDRSCQIQRQHTLELFRIKVEKSLVGCYSGTGHIAAGGIEQGVDAAILRHYCLTISLDNSLVHHIRFHELYGTGRLRSHDFFNNHAACFFLSAKNYDLSAVLGEICRYGAAEHTRTARYDGHIIFYIE